MNMPNFLIIGSAKAGTSSLHYYLRQHPQIFMPFSKEPKFFALEGEEINFQNPDKGINLYSINNLEDYQKLFEDVTDEIAIGEASPIYLYSEKAADRIKHYIPDVKMIVILRHPVDRAFSCYTHLKREDYEPLSFEEGLKAEPSRIANNWSHLWHYQTAGYYHAQLKPYFERFDEKQFKIYLFEDLCRDSLGILRDIFEFLGVDPDFNPDMTKQNVSGMPKSMLLQKFFSRDNVLRSTIQTIVPEDLRHNAAKRIKQWNIGKKPELLPQTRQQLTAIYRDDILKLQNLIDRDLSTWLK
ncbi:sulfotransferase [Leptolyngbyaceae cyanobacterium CCMR0082]|uniref:Sulfotransferase n=1 Tax=Adonisia turfae CCMR0082 TaxID=2304604 RepID=A0A6M0SF55_9CYAN|nr:sulfotransferase [Adonisia turfae]NEZ67150.1 sulfotransferase [Adonisia turfae CCMR0082]